MNFVERYLLWHCLSDKARLLMVAVESFMLLGAAALVWAVY